MLYGGVGCKNSEAQYRMHMPVWTHFQEHHTADNHQMPLLHGEVEGGGGEGWGAVQQKTRRMPYTGSPLTGCARKVYPSHKETLDGVDKASLENVTHPQYAVREISVQE